MASSSSTSSSSSSTSISLLPSEPLPWRPNTRPKLPPGALLDIADDLLWDLFTEWLPIEAVCGLDSALCQKRRRPYFLALLATKVLLFNREEIRVLTDPYQRKSFAHRALGVGALNWILKRGINLASLQLPCHYSKTSAAEQQSIRDAVATLALNGHLDKLETVSLCLCQFIRDADFKAILSKCYSSVKSIDIKGCMLTKGAVSHIKRCTKLEEFVSQGNESAANMVEIFKTCRKLRKVNLFSIGYTVTDKVVQSLADHSHLLEHLCLDFCSMVSDATVVAVAESCPSLQYVSLSNTDITNASVVALCKQCVLLKGVFLGNCHNLTDVVVLAVAERLPGITHISLAGISAITSSAVETLASKCRELEVIYLTGCFNVSDATLMKIAEYCSKLKRLRVDGCLYVTDVGLAEIRSKCAKLTDFELEEKDDEEEEETEEEEEEEEEEDEEEDDMMHENDA